MASRSSETIQRAVREHGSQRAAARALGMAQSTLNKHLQRGSGAGYVTRPRPKRRPHGFSREEFATAYDTDTRVRAALRTGVATLTDDNEIIDDNDFRNLRCGRAPNNGWRRISEEEEFKPYRFTVRGRTFWATQGTRQWALENVEGAAEG